MSNAFSSVGTVLKLGSPLVTIAEITSITGPNKARDTIEVTNLDSTGGYREFIPSFRDGGEITTTGNYTRAGFDTVNDEFELETVTPIQLILNDTGNTTLDGSVYVTNIGQAQALDDKVTLDVTYKVTGQVTLTT